MYSKISGYKVSVLGMWKYKGRINEKIRVFWGLKINRLEMWKYRERNNKKIL